ncbi:tripartite tricarboxylate transporter substrate binding protein [Sporosarcina oncorhynchi]|uniref:Tripartite tricarboxylate transporter substrate binding protein n=1 Tax=Sporosarcina oncorhynchi TaxID=3056444 RepID=A0ABZ0L822_9BACL|nr:tripartite tricarboxylate transporter substrate binding protein [Sporosarcina sp. T2O-4]WOV88093.1 tripartite tricarboxylate transporter substrate binding protein [Sporosarcina sp. T2O-4]
MKKFMKSMGLVAATALMLAVAGCGNDKDSSGSADGASDFPKKSITMISPTSAGGGTDATARALAADVEKHLGQSVGVVNKPGGSGSVGMTEGANAKPDGYTVTMVIAELTMLEHMGVSTLNQDQMRAIAMINLDPAALTVAADAPYNTLEEFIAYAKDHPGEIKVGNAGSGSIWHVAAESLAKNAEIELNHIPFEGAAPAVTALVGGHVDAVTVSPAEVKTQIDAGNLKTLAVMSDKRTDIMPDVPTFEEAGLPTETIATWRGITVPKDTPDEIAAILEDAFMKAAEEENFKKFMSSNGLGVEVKGADEFTTFMDENYDYYKQMFAELGLN